MSDLDFPRLPPQRAIPVERSAQRQALLEHHVVASEPTRTPWWRRKLVIVPAVAVVAVSATAAGQALLPGGVATQATTVSCYKTVSLHGDTDIVGGGVTDPVESCRQVWQSTGMNVPSELAACLTPDGAITVFPSKEACRTLGLRPFMGVSDSARSFAAFQNDVVTAVRADHCRPRNEIIDMIRGKLDAYGLQSWRIDDSGFGQPWAAGRPCASLAFNHDRSTVIIVPHTK
ncbi:hypothetical protein FDG2_0708 [Candidatus Protofrankia californiensis]|uniref:Uncharacterized protein n=1 Tax=Candidatus Protofrankia californiensis TaxID=1839754 RepID=A0A1C3NU34_9ACTN|nr:hypothetical protein FDG2_0708 [Candidatus Protofrankia californiensis]